MSINPAGLSDRNRVAYETRITPPLLWRPDMERKPLAPLPVAFVVRAPVALKPRSGPLPLAGYGTAPAGRILVELLRLAEAREALPVRWALAKLAAVHPGNMAPALRCLRDCRRITMRCDTGAGSRGAWCLRLLETGAELRSAGCPVEWIV